VIVKYRELIQEAIEKQDLEILGKLRNWSQRFETEGVLWLPPDQPEMLRIYREFGKSRKAAGDTLREAYSEEIKRLNAAQQFSDANALIADLEERRLPAKIISLQLFRSQAYLYHYGGVLRGQPANSVELRLNATFELLPGFSNLNFTSIRSVNVPTNFIAHSGFRIQIRPMQDNDDWRRHASWIVKPGLADRNNGISFMSVTHLNRYIRIRPNGEAWLDTNENTPAFSHQATFTKERPLFKMW
jgi:hypothetical protein